MKRLFILFSLFLFVLPVQAKEMQVPKLLAEVDRICAPLTYSDNTIPAVFECLRHEYTNQANYTPGWSKYVKADIQLKLVGDAAEKYPIKTTSRQSEEIAAKIAIPMLDQIYETALEEIYKQPDIDTVIPASVLKNMRY